MSHVGREVTAERSFDTDGAIRPTNGPLQCGSSGNITLGYADFWRQRTDQNRQIPLDAAICNQPHLVSKSVPKAKNQASGETPELP